MPFAPVRATEPAAEWIDCRVDGGEWRGGGGARMLSRILRHFLDWADARSGERAT